MDFLASGMLLVLLPLRGFVHQSYLIHCRQKVGQYFREFSLKGSSVFNNSESKGLKGHTAIV